MKPKTKQQKPKVSKETLQKREASALFRKIYKYENNLTEAITSVYEDSDPTLLATLLYVALYPQLKNHINIHHYKDFHLLIQNDEAFRARVYANEKPYSYMEDEVLHYDLMPMLHHQLMDAVREMVVSGAGRKYHNTINKIADAIRPKGDELCDNR
jgi:hypothetical protein